MKSKETVTTVNLRVSSNKGDVYERFCIYGPLTFEIESIKSITWLRSIKSNKDYCI